MASLALQMAIENPHITVSVTEITEFPQLAQKYEVMGVPLVIVDEKIRLEGQQTEDSFVAHAFKQKKKPSNGKRGPRG